MYQTGYPLHVPVLPSISSTMYKYTLLIGRTLVVPEMPAKWGSTIYIMYVYIYNARIYTYNVHIYI